MKVYRVTVEGAGTNAADRVVRFFSNMASAQDYADHRRADAVGVTVQVLRVRD